VQEDRAVVKAALGFRAHLGWAAVAVVSGVRARPILADRRRISLSCQEVPESHEPYHKAAEQREDEDRARAIIAVGTRAIHAEARKSVRAVVKDLAKSGYEVVAAGVLMDLGRKASFESTLRSHALVHTAEGQLMRAALISACEACELRVALVRERELFERAATHLKLAPAQLTRRVSDLGKDQGPPWREDQKKAALVAWLALAGMKA
jgi:hypothetical protein